MWGSCLFVGRTGFEPVTSGPLPTRYQTALPPDKQSSKNLQFFVHFYRYATVWSGEVFAKLYE